MSTGGRIVPVVSGGPGVTTGQIILTPGVARPMANPANMIYIHYSADVAAVLRLFWAATSTPTAANAIPIVADTLQYFSRYCVPIPCADGGIPFNLYLDVAAGATWNLRAAWEDHE